MSDFAEIDVLVGTQGLQERSGLRRRLTICGFHSLGRPGINRPSNHSLEGCRTGCIDFRTATELIPLGTTGFLNYRRSRLVSRKTAQSLRNRAFQDQKGRCFYCSAMMWLSAPEHFSREFGISIRAAYRFQCTAEHLIARRDGGRDTKENVVAACRFCNLARHKRAKPPAPERYRAIVQGHLERRRWHPERLWHLVSRGSQLHYG